MLVLTLIPRTERETLKFRLLALAAVIGRDFGLATLRSIANTDDEALVGHLEEAIRIGVLEERARVGGVQYRFAHAFFRQTLYEELSAARRLRLHQQVARALEAEYAARVEEHAAELAEHFTQSTDPADLAKAIQYGELAAQRALSVYAYGEAARLLEQALEVQEVLDPDDKARRCDLLLALGEAMMPAGESRVVVEEVAPQAFALAEALGDTGRCSRACNLALAGLSGYWGPNVAPTMAGFQEWAGRADKYAAPGTLDRVHADLALARVLRAGEWRQAQGLAERAVQLALALGEPDLAFQAAGSGLYLASPRSQKARLQLAEEVVARLGASQAPAGLRSFRTEGGGVFLQWGRREQAEELWRRARELADRTRDPRVLLRVARLEIVIPVLDGRLEEALAAGEGLLDRGGELGNPGLGRQFYGNVSHRARLYRGQAEAALAALDLAYPSSDWSEVSGVPARRALAHAHAGQLQPARDILERALEELHIEAERDGPTAMLVMLLETATLLGDRERAALLAELLRELAGIAAPWPDFTCIARHLAAAAVLLGDPEGAREYCQQALELGEKLRHRPEIALIRLQMAELLLEQDRRTEALEHLDFAIAEFRDMKMQPSLERALKHKGLLGA